MRGGAARRGVAWHTVGGVGNLLLTATGAPQEVGVLEQPLQHGRVLSERRRQSCGQPAAATAAATSKGQRCRSGRGGRGGRSLVQDGRKRLATRHASGWAEASCHTQCLAQCRAWCINWLRVVWDASRLGGVGPPTQCAMWCAIVRRDVVRDGGGCSGACALPWMSASFTGSMSFSSARYCCSCAWRQGGARSGRGDGRREQARGEATVDGRDATRERWLVWRAGCLAEGVREGAGR